VADGEQVFALHVQPSRNSVVLMVGIDIVLELLHAVRRKVSGRCKLLTRVPGCHLNAELIEKFEPEPEIEKDAISARRAARMRKRPLLR
jgi:hypothetical protein